MTVPAFQAHEIAFQKEVESLGAELHLVSWEMPQPWRNDSPDHKHRKANSDHIADYANLVVARVLYAKALGFKPAYIELTNEPDGDWNTQYTPGQYDALVVAARTTLDKYNLQDVKIEGPGIGLGGGTDHVANYLNAIRTNGHGDMLGLVTAHDYDVSRVGSKWPRLNFILPAIQAFGRPLDLYYTEFGNSSHYWGQPPYTGGVKFRSAHNGVDTPDFGVTSGGDAIKLMAEGANAEFIWELADESWGKGSRGLVSIKGDRKPALRWPAGVFRGTSLGYLRRRRVGRQVAADHPGLPDPGRPAGRRGQSLGGAAFLHRQLRPRKSGTDEHRRDQALRCDRLKRRDHESSRARGRRAPGRDRAPARCSPSHSNRRASPYLSRNETRVRAGSVSVRVPSLMTG